MLKIESKFVLIGILLKNEYANSLNIYSYTFSTLLPLSKTNSHQLTILHVNSFNSLKGCHYVTGFVPDAGRPRVKFYGHLL